MRADFDKNATTQDNMPYESFSRAMWRARTPCPPSAQPRAEDGGGGEVATATASLARNEACHTRPMNREITRQPKERQATPSSRRPNQGHCPPR